MNTVLLVIHIMIAVALVAVILFQRSSSDGLGGLGGGGGGNAFLSGRASANLLTRATAILATLFIASSLILAAIASHNSKNESLIQAIEKNNMTEEGKTVDKKPAVPSVPMAQ